MANTLPSSPRIFNWHNLNEDSDLTRSAQIVDESTRDGLQGIPGVSLNADQKLQLVEASVKIGIQDITVGIFGSPEQNVITSEVVERLRIQYPNVKPIVLVRAAQPDIDFAKKLLNLNPNTIPLVFFGSSGIRTHIQKWDFGNMMDNLENYAYLLCKEGAVVMVATEDTTRTTPKRVKRLAQAAINSGAKRLCIADTVGFATPAATHNIVNYVREYLDSNGGNNIVIDFHGHNDLGLAAINNSAAISAGADNVHVTIAGIGERSGNASLEQTIFTLRAHGQISEDQFDLKMLIPYANLYSRLTGVPISDYAPVIGRNAHKTVAGIHADAIVKAFIAGERELAEEVYFSYKPSLVGAEIDVDIDAQSGISNVVFFILTNSLDTVSEQQLHLILSKIQAEVRENKRLLTHEEKLSIYKEIIALEG